MSDNLPSEDPGTSSAAQQGGKSTDVMRRRLIRGGLATAPVLLSISSRSVMACESTTPSCFGSLSASRPDVLVPVSGQPPSYWCTHHSAWPSSCHPTTTKGVGGHSATLFKSCFSPSRFSSSCTLLDALNQTNGCNDVVAQHCAAAYLNALTGKTSVILNTGVVQNIWREYASNGYFQPVAGVRWYANNSSNSGSGITGYMKSTWTG
jgi:hypothetical protein